MALRETLTGTQTSGEFTPTTGSVDVMLDGDFGPNGLVTLEYQLDGEAEWYPLRTYSGFYREVMQTPDQTVKYRFNAVEVGSVRVYLGP